MRPSAGGDALPSTKPRSRKSSVADPSYHSPSSNVPTAFFLRSEGDMEQSMSSSQDTESASKPRDSTFGVQSLADTLEAAFGRGNGSTAGERTASFEGSDSNKRQNSRSCSNTSSQRSANPSESPPSSPSRRRKRNLSNQTISSSISPLNTDARSPLPNSAMPSTPKSLSLHSLKLGDEDFTLDEVASQAITSSGEEEDEDDTQQGESSSFPQLVMPSIQMPTRRPFTNKGKSMGKLKILIAGEAGIGKSSLIRSIVQLCDDIVHVDPLCLSRSMPQSQLAETLFRKKRSESTVYARISENHASTKPYPEWYTEVEESRVLRRRKSSKSTADAVLERNICFVDTPGFGQGTSRTADMNTIVEYVESLLYQSASVTSMEDSDVLGVFSGNGGISVDVVIYLLPPCQDISKDVDFMQRLSAVTNVIPVIAKSDTLSFAEIIAVKTSILARLQSTAIKPFFFGKALEDALLAVQGLSLGHSPPTETRSMNPDMSGLSQYPFTIPTYPYAISSAPGPDSENMDASLLMSPDYVQPLFSSELATLINQIFDPESIAWLRHCAAKKFVAWRNRTRLSGDSFILQTLQQQQQPRSPISASVGLNGAALNTSTASSIFSAASPSGVLVPRTGSPFYPSNSELQSPFLASSPSLANSDRLDHPTEFSLTRYNNHTQGDQKFSEIRLAKWATDLQRSLRNERDRFEELQRNERARWLLERVGEEVARGNIVSSPGGSPRADWAVVRRNNEKQVGQVGLRYGNARSLDSRDPLGLCDFSDEVRRRGYIFVKVLGGVSVLGAVVVAVVRACGVETGLPEGGIWNWITGGKE